MEVISTLLKQKVSGDIRWDWEEIHVPRKEYLFQNKPLTFLWWWLKTFKVAKKFICPLKNWQPIFSLWQLAKETCSKHQESYPTNYFVLFCLITEKKIYGATKDTEKNNQTAAPVQNASKQKNGTENPDQREYHETDVHVVKRPSK